MKKNTIFLMLMLFVASTCMMSCIDADDLISNVGEEDEEIVDEDGDGIPDDAVDEGEDDEEEEQTGTTVYTGYVNENGEYILASFTGGFIPTDSDTWTVNCAVIDGLATTDDFAYLRSALISLAEDGDRQITLILTDVEEIPSYALCGEYEFEEGQPYTTTPTALKSITATTATYVGDYAFAGCSNLTDVSLDMATEFGTGSFMVCKGLTDISFPNVETLGKWAFAYCEYLTDLDTNSLPSVVTVGQGAFYLCRSIVSATLLKATSLAYTAFSRCEQLEYVTMPLLESIGEEGFSDCPSLETISLSKVTSIGHSAFKYCYALTTATFPSAVTFGSGTPKEGSHMFGYCYNLKTLTIAVNSSVITNFVSDMFFNGYDLDSDGTSYVGYQDQVDLKVGQDAYDSYASENVFTCLSVSYTFNSITVTK